ncbi:hypothetical protein [Paenibacillus fonticola]|uniref:hypothetical protein n=1 Tax=Paenibacillus fonticola TaxID=379896 RepID=UPI0003796642|nr:hypothetical protein [Paenibacillus fonticola]
MNRKIRTSEIILLTGLSFIFLFMIVHDWVPLGQLNDVQAVSESRSVNELIVVTLIGATQILLLMALVLLFMGRKKPLWIKLWLIIHQGFIFAGVLLDWWIPYLLGFGAKEKTERYMEMFGNTHAFLPVNNGIVPNTIHVVFHFTLLVCLLVTIYISFTRPKHNQYILQS